MTPKIDKNNKVFYVQLSSIDTPIPEINVGNDENKKIISCEKYTEDQSKIKCTPTDAEMPKTDDYKIFYKGACNEIKDTGIIVSYQLTTSITVSSISLSSSAETYCNTEPFNQFIFAIDKKMNGDIDYAILTNEDQLTVKFI